MTDPLHEGVIRHGDLFFPLYSAIWVVLAYCGSDLASRLPGWTCSISLFDEIDQSSLTRTIFMELVPP